MTTENKNKVLKTIKNSHADMALLCDIVQACPNLTVGSSEAEGGPHYPRIEKKKKKKKERGIPSLFSRLSALHYPSRRKREKEGKQVWVSPRICIPQHVLQYNFILRTFLPQTGGKKGI